MPEALAELQAWMLDGIRAGAAPRAEVKERIAGDARLRAEARFAIYAGGYRSRLLQTLREDYPALLLLVGDTVFGLFAESYIATQPPRHFSLYDYGAGFADHLEATRPQDGGPLTALPAQVARLERARAEVQRAEGLERRPGPLLTADAAMLPGLRLKLPDSVRLLRLDFDLLPLLDAADDGGKAIVPEQGESLVAVARSRWQVRAHRLRSWQLAWLEALGGHGAEVQQAAAAAASMSGRDGGALLADLALWLPAASSVGLVTSA
ncbi:MAG: putative DNA-binding domain-containing protein [Sphingomonadaceae bacterium]|nr:putative DNA-binding domain-containing protein [Sphingomonadaceae bacterium]